VDANVFQGFDLTLTCSAYFHPVLDTPVTVMGTWLRNGSQLEEDDDHITVTNATMIGASPFSYQTIVRLNPIDFDDVGTHTCMITIMPYDTRFVTGTTTSSSRTIADISGRANFMHAPESASYNKLVCGCYCTAWW
jgi:hypothetical protein